MITIIVENCIKVADMKLLRDRAKSAWMNSVLCEVAELIGAYKSK